MAEAIFVGAITGAAVGALLTAVIDKTKSAVRCKENCENLRTTLKEIRPLLDRVDQSKDGNNATCQAWLRTVNTLLEKADRVLGKCTIPKKSRFHVQYVTKWRISSSIKDLDRQIKEKLPQVNLLTLDIVQLIYQIMTGQSMVSPGVDTSEAVVMQAVPEKIVTHENNPFQKMKELIISVADLPSREPVTFGLKGRGGAGKTLLAKMVNNDEDIQAKYGVGSVVWITIGKDASIPSTYKTMARFLGCGDVYERDYTHRRMEDQRTYLMEAFKRKRVLLILDDVWESTWENRAIIYWLDICKGVGSTTLITTRNDSVLHRAKAIERIDILSLSEEESWKLFSYHAFQTSIPLQGELESLAKQVCGECKGLPLALEVIGGALWGKKDIIHWRFALSRLKRSESMCNSNVVDDELFHRLKFSYDELDDDLKKCFLYFAAFPEDMEIKPNKLCSIWQGEGLFGTHDGDDAFQMGWTALISLADQSLIDLFEKGGEKYAKVHDVLRDLAIRIIRNAKAGEWAFECFFEPGKVLETLPPIKEGIKRVSFIGSTIKQFGSSNKLDSPSIQVCLLSDVSFQMDPRSRRDMGQVYLSYIFSNMSKLLYLDLSKWRYLEKLPKGIKELKCLTHLDLYRCTFLKELPEGIKELKCLTLLNLSGCAALKELPEGIKELKCLTHLVLLGCTSLKELPEGIKELKCMTHLDLSWCTSLKELPEGIKELKCLIHLNLLGCTSLKELPEDIKELKCLTHLHLSGCTSLKELPEGIKELKCLTHLDLYYCTSLKELPEGIMELKCLTESSLRWCSVFLEKV
ncbi:hypothetical protein KC19_2G141600 [Ceratodon purpureus]|uniref:RPW8 domain-containing protein n=1 Tax=Ceratodon purpureus TaxID=3225 RepID=A0A8T0IVZ3_CERPU|nr:hypothetical protein KC19_2G141600 [Ceratodon purpureus]